MSVDLTDPNIASTYDDIIKRRVKDWMLLSYGQTRDKLSLLASGEGDFDDLCRSISRTLDDVYFGFCRERDGERNYFALLTFIPPSASGVRRARALVHARAVGSSFKAANISMNVTDLNAVNIDMLRERLHLSPSLIPRLASNSDRTFQRSASMPSAPRSSTESSKFQNGLLQSPRARGIASESQGWNSSIESLSHMPRIPSEIDEDRPPPTPPKDPLLNNSVSAFARSVSMSPDYGSPRPHTAYASDGVIIIGSNVRKTFIDSSRPRGPPRVVSPAEKARLRLEAQKQRNAEEEQAQREEAERQARLKQEKEEALRQAQEQEEHRLEKLREEKRRALLERGRREREFQLEEEHRLRETELRREQERARRMEQARRFEEERQEIERRMAEAARRRMEECQQADVRRKQRMKEIQEKFMHTGRSEADPILFTGVVTVQTSMSINWKRRFFELTGNALVFYRDSQDRTSPLDIMSLAEGRVAAIKEPYEGYDELEAIPYSFAVEFADGESAWSMFSDSAEDKDVLVSLLSQAAGL